MDVINKILGVQEDFEEPSDGNLITDSDVFDTFIQECSDFTKANKDINNIKVINGELDKLQEKHSKIKESIETVIPELKEYLTNFNKQLSEFTNELSFIRNKSTELKNLLDNNSKMLSNISPLVNDLIIPPKVINSILHGKINSAWQDNITFIKDKEQIYAKYKDITARDDCSSAILLPKDFDSLCDLLNILKSIILERSKKFIISKIKMLRSGHPVPSQRVQKQLLQVQQIYEFIIENNYSLALEIRQAYAYTMKWYYREYFSRYIRSLTILQFKFIDSQYALGNILANSTYANKTDNLASSLFTSYLTTHYNFTSTVTNDMINEYFKIQKRLSILTQEDNTVMVSQIAENNNTKDNFIEIGFKNLNLAILDNCTVEFDFMKRFFQISNNTEEVNGLIEQIFKPTFNNALTYTETVLVDPSVYDIFGTLISIRIANQLIIESRKRSISIMESYLEDQLMVLWPKFQQLIDWQAESLNNTNISQTKLDESTILSSPCDITMSFTFFLESLLILTTKSPSNPTSDKDNSEIILNEVEFNKEIVETIVDESSEPLYNSIIRIRNDYETIMTKFSKTTKSPEKFLSINYLYLYNSLQQQSLSLMESNELYNEANDSSILKITEAHYKILVEAFNQH